MRWVITVLTAIAAMGSMVAGTGTAEAAPDCQFVLGFKALYDAIPAIVGTCTTDEIHVAANGDAIQRTTGTPSAAANGGGELVWRKADNWTAYTDGYQT